jgi:hypothetical protein
MIEVIFSDIDGCFVPQGYDALGSLQLDGDSEEYFEYYRNYSGPQLVLCTGRAWANTFGILHRAGFFPHQRPIWPEEPVLCEHGVDVIIDPANGKRTSLIHELREFEHFGPSVASIKDAGNQLELALDRIHGELEQYSGRKVTPILLLRKDFSVAVRIPYFEGTAQQVDASVFLQSISQVVQKPLGLLLKDGAVRIAQSSSAVDMTLPIGKGDGVKYLLERYGTSPRRAAYIGDSVPDIEGMQQVCLACCPANAVPAVKAYVASLGSRGYISPLKFADAEIDILNHIQDARL